MYQKRPGWILTGVAPNRGDATSLADIVLAVQTEIPLMKQHLSDQLWAVRGEGAHGIRYNRITQEAAPLAIRPSTAVGLRNGFATVCRFFPGGRDVLGALDDELCARLLGPVRPGEAAVSNDQYACTGGQLYGLMMGQDRLVADLRPLIAPIVHARGEAAGHFCHPYDLCTKLIAEEAGVIVTDANGKPIAAPLDTESDVSWIGYANQRLQLEIEPVLGELMRSHGLLVSSEGWLSARPVVDANAASAASTFRLQRFAQRHSIVVGAILLLSRPAIAEMPPELLELTGDLTVHDPAIIKQGESYYLFCTGGARGQGVVTIRTSPDLRHWTCSRIRL